MSAPSLNRRFIRDLAVKAEEQIEEEQRSKSWADLFPIVEPFLATGSRYAIPQAVTFLIDEGVISENERVAAEAAFRRERNKRQNEEIS